MVTCRQVVTLYAIMDLTTPSQSSGKPVFSIASILSLVFAILSFRSGAGGGFVLAVLAITFGAIGFLASVLPGKRGGILSIFSIFAGAIGIIAAIFKLLGNVLG